MANNDRGPPLASNHYSCPIGTTSVRILGPNSRRCGLLFSPTSLNRCGIAFGQPAKIGTGITLYPGTQLQLIDYDCVGESLYQDVYAIFETTGETLGVWEILE